MTTRQEFEKQLVITSTKLTQAALGGAEARLGPLTLGPPQLEELATDLSPDDPGRLDRLAGRLEKLEKRFPDPLARLIGAQFLRHGFLDGVRRPAIRRRVASMAASALIYQLDLLATTPREYVPKPAPESEMLTSKMLDNAAEFLQLCEGPGNIAEQLSSPLDLTIKGLTIKMGGEKGFDQLSYGPIIPACFVSILKTLKYQEAERVFHSWLEAKLYNQRDFEGAVKFLSALVNFTCFNDSVSHLQLFGAPDVPNRRREILLQPFLCLSNILETTVRDLRRFGNKELSGTLVQIGEMLQLRYYQVYHGIRTSLYTTTLEALNLTPEQFASLSMTMAITNNHRQLTPSETAAALVRLADFAGVTDLKPLVGRFEGEPGLRDQIIEQAKLFGLIPDPEATIRADNALTEKGFEDAARVDFAELIDSGTTDITIFAITLTGAPFTKGHRDLIEKLLALIESEEKSEATRSHKVAGTAEKTQRFILVVPATRVEKIPGYHKDAAESGSDAVRLRAMLLQIADLDPKILLFTTLLQPDPSRVKSLAGRVFSTVTALQAKIARDLEKRDRAHEAKTQVVFAFALDEIATDDGQIVPKDRQPRKVREPSVVVTRRGEAIKAIGLIEQIIESTGIRTMILTAGTPHTSSSRVRTELAQTGTTNSVLAPAKKLVEKYWSPRSVAQRRERERKRHT